VVFRAALGVEASLLTRDGPTSLRTPTFGILDLGFAPVPELVLWLRATSWFSFEPVAFQFFGLGASRLWVEEQMFASAFLGLTMLDDELGLPGGSEERVQGLAAQLEIGQLWPISSRFDFALGVRFELGTPWAGDGYDAANLAFGPFIALNYR
jgi:hypothetical protein